MMEIEKLIHVENGKNKDKQKKKFRLGPLALPQKT